MYACARTHTIFLCFLTIPCKFCWKLTSASSRQVSFCFPIFCSEKTDCTEESARPRGPDCRASRALFGERVRTPYGALHLGQTRAAPVMLLKFKYVQTVCTDAERLTGRTVLVPTRFPLSFVFGFSPRGMPGVELCKRSCLASGHTRDFDNGCT